MSACLCQLRPFQLPFAALPEKLALGLFSVLTRGMTAKTTPISDSLSAPALPQAQEAPHHLTAAQAADLIMRVGRQQDRDAFVALFRYFAPRVKSYLLKNGADEATAEEIVQNTFITVWDKAATFNNNKAAASTWIFTIARNKRIDIMRRQKFVVAMDEDAPLLDNLAAEQTEEYADAQTREKLHSAMDQLPAEQAELLRMAFFEDKSHQAISQETALPLGTVKSRLRLAMDKLRHALKTEKA